MRAQSTGTIDTRPNATERRSGPRMKVAAPIKYRPLLDRFSRAGMAATGLYRHARLVDISAGGVAFAEDDVVWDGEELGVYIPPLTSESKGFLATVQVVRTSRTDDGTLVGAAFRDRVSLD